MSDGKHPGGRPSKYAIYELRCPDSGDVRYIGQTACPKRRLAAHCRYSYRDDTPKAKWAMALVSAGKRPVMKVVEWCDDWDEPERRWIAKYRSEGVTLLNANDGGRTMGHITRRVKPGPPSAVTFMIRKMRNFARDLAGEGNNERAAAFHEIADGLHARRREIWKESGPEGVSLYEQFIAGIMGDRWGGEAKRV